MNAETYTWAYSGFSSESECNSNTTCFPLQGPPALDEGWTNTLALDIPVCSHYPQVDAEAHNARFLVGRSALPSYHLTRIFRHATLVSINHCIPLFGLSTKQLRYHSLKPTSLISMSTRLSPNSPVLPKWTSCARDRSLGSTLYDDFLI